jgi:hypothetical protein
VKGEKPIKNENSIIENKIGGETFRCPALPKFILTTLSSGDFLNRSEDVLGCILKIFFSLAFLCCIIKIRKILKRYKQNSLLYLSVDLGKVAELILHEDLKSTLEYIFWRY